MTSRWSVGEATIADLIERERLECVQDDPEGADRMLNDGGKNVESAAKIADDASGAFALAYDGVRKAATAALLRQGLRPVGGEGSHAVVGEAIEAQLGAVSAPVKAFEWMRATRNRAQYKNQAPSAKEVAEALQHAQTAVAALRDWIPYLGRFW